MFRSDDSLIFVWWPYVDLKSGLRLLDVSPRRVANSRVESCGSWPYVALKSGLRLFDVSSRRVANSRVESCGSSPYGAMEYGLRVFDVLPRRIANSRVLAICRSEIWVGVFICLAA